MCSLRQTARSIRIPIIEGAGGVVTTYDGGDACMGGTVIAAANRALHARALDILNGR